MTGESKQVQTTITNLGGGWKYPTVAVAGSNEVHVWEFRSDVPDYHTAEVGGLLALEEKERAARFHFQRDAQRFCVTHARMRSILGAYLQSDPRELTFASSPHGKPSIPDIAPDIRFNLSHSGDHAILGVAVAREIGVDVEKTRENVECEQLAERFFSVNEREFMRGLAAEQKLPAFFRLWTCKEAFLKAHGSGLSRTLSSFDVRLGNSPGELLKIRGDASEENRWSLVELESSAGYAAAAVVEGELQAIRAFRIE
jgi:4'-phosphopantetheinyl transferase